MLIAWYSAMECYFGASELPTDSAEQSSAVVMFTIPEIGIQFKAPFDGVDPDHNDLASLLALLEFIDSNQKYFSTHTYQLYGTNRNIIEQINGQRELRFEFAPLLQKAARYRKKYSYSLDWVSPGDNSAFGPLFD